VQDRSNAKPSFCIRGDKSMHGFRKLFIICLATLAFAQSYSQLLTVDPSKRYLTQDGKPFLLVGDAAWSLIAQLSDQDADLYLKNRHAMGYTAVLVNLIEHQFATNAPMNIYNQSPFSGAAFSSTPNEAYFAHVDHIINAAYYEGIVVLLAPVYLGYLCGSQGWCVEVKNADTSAMRSWGRYVGQRYAGNPNIIWVIGGDTDPGSVKPKLRAVVNGIKEYDNNHLFTVHDGPEQTLTAAWPGESWININNVYTYSTTQYENCASAYTRNPILPFFLLESAYENEHGSTQQELRAQSYWAMLSGAFGHVFGNCPIWGFDAAAGFCTVSNWKGQINGQGSQNMKHFHDLFYSRNWHRLIPDVTHTAVTAGYGTLGQTSYVTAAYCSDSSSIIAYLPTSRTVTVNTSLVAGDSVAAWWFNPSNGTYTRVGTFAHGSSMFTPPGAGDWVLVIDNEDLYPDVTNPPVSDVRENVGSATIAGAAYPNPFKTTLHIPTQNSSIVEVFDILGRRVLSERIEPGQTAFTWTPRNIGYGVYFVRFGGTVRLYKVLYVP